MTELETRMRAMLEKTGLYLEKTSGFRQSLRRMQRGLNSCMIRFLMCGATRLCRRRRRTG